jgi:hypothetical protein
VMGVQIGGFHLGFMALMLLVHLSWCRCILVCLVARGRQNLNHSMAPLLQPSANF